MHVTQDFSGQKNLDSRVSTDRPQKIVHQDLTIKSPRVILGKDQGGPTFSDDGYKLPRPPHLSSNFLIESTKEYAELVFKESDKYKMRDNLALRLSKEDKFSSLSDNEKIELVGCLKAKIALFRELERSRIQLAECQEFNLADLFFLAKKLQDQP